MRLLRDVSMLALLAAPLAAQSSKADSVVIRVMSRRDAQTTFSGVITLRDSKSERRFDKVTTPFEIRIPAEFLEARFIADDGGSLGGELLPVRDGKALGNVNGHSYVGKVELFYQPGVGFGFGKRAPGRAIP